MSFISFGRSLYRDSCDIMNIINNIQSRPNKSEISRFATTLKRCKQTIEDWLLFASLQEVGEDSINQLKKYLNNFLQNTVRHMKAPTDITLNLLKQEHITLCKNIVKNVGKDGEKIQGIMEYINNFKADTINATNETNSSIINQDNTKQTHNSSSLSSSIFNQQKNISDNSKLSSQCIIDNSIQENVNNELKSLAKTVLVNLKDLSTIVMHSIRSRESTASHFASAARASLETTKKFSNFAIKNGYQDEADKLNNATLLFINHSKEIFIRPIPEGNQQQIVASMLEKERANIAICIKNILSKSNNKVKMQSQSSISPQRNISSQSPQRNISSQLTQKKDISPLYNKINDNTSPIKKKNEELNEDKQKEIKDTNDNTNLVISNDNSLINSNENNINTTEQNNNNNINDNNNKIKNTKPLSITKQLSDLQSSGKSIGKLVKAPSISEINQEELSEKQKKRAKDREHAFLEIISSEKVYFKNLQFVYWSIISTLEEKISKNIPIISPQELQFIFSNWQSLLNFNKELIKSFEKRKNIPITERLIGDTFLELSSLMKMYTEFVNNFDHSTEIANKCMQRPVFTEFINKCLEEAPQKGLSLQSYLIMPVQRLPRYEMLLRALLKLTEEHHPDYENLSKAVQKVKAINDHVNLKKKEAEYRAIVYGIQEKLYGYDNLVQAHRLFIREGELLYSASANPKKTKKRDLYYFFLFNDILLRSRFNKKKNLYEVRETIALTEYSLRDVTYSPFMSSSERFCFRLVQQRDERTGVSFFASSLEEKTDWYMDIEEAIKTRDAADSSRFH